MSDKITIIDVAREMGIEIHSELTWAVGAIVRDEWIAERGESPIKDLRQKTHGAGSHCFAIYPAGWKDRIASHYKRLGAFSAAQGRLAFEDAGNFIEHVMSLSWCEYMPEQCANELTKES